MKKSLAAAALGAAVLSAAVAAAAGAADPGLDMARTAQFDFDPPKAGTYTLPVIKPLPDGAVLDEDGKRRSLRALVAGRIALISFIYTRCSDPNGCPLATAVLYDIHDASAADRALAENLHMVSLSFDPAHDTPEVMAGFRGFDTGSGPARSEWSFLTTASQADLDPILADFDQVVRRRVDAQGKDMGLYAHQLRVYLVDRRGRVRNIYGLGFLDPRLLVADVHTLLAEERRAASQ
ncbi:MAG: SCO family protein [Hyphomicrobiales bacterium]|nr:SCO family protein [Hyphomicrobiales bacterium]